MAEGKNGKNQAQNETYKALVKSLGGRTSGYIPKLGNLYGVKCGVLLSQLIYWQARYPNSEFYITVNDLYDQTGLNAEEQRNARERLCRAGVLRAIIKGFPRNWHYQVLITELVNQCSQSSRKSITEKVNHRESLSLRKPITEKVSVIGGESPSPLVEKVHHHSSTFSTNDALDIKGINKDYLKDYNIRLTPPPPSENEIFDDDQSPIEEEEVSQGVWMSESLLDDLRDFGVFENNITEVEEAVKAGWSEDAIRELMAKVEDDYLAGRVKSKPGSLLHRLRNLKPPKPKVNKYKLCPYCGEYPCVCEEDYG